jgi:hypothetical protein
MSLDEAVDVLVAHLERVPEDDRLEAVNRCVGVLQPLEVPDLAEQREARADFPDDILD